MTMKFSISPWSICQFDEDDDNDNDDDDQALQYRIWSLGLASKVTTKKKFGSFGQKWVLLGPFWDSSLSKMLQNLRKSKPALKSA